VKPGTWKIREVGSSPWLNSYPTAFDSNGRYHSVTVVSQGSYPNTDFGNFKSATINGVKFEDLDADGAAREGGEPGLGGWVIWVDYDNDNVYDPTGPGAEPSATTAADGSYSITGVAPGTWQLREDLGAHTGWKNSNPGTSGAQSVTVVSDQTLNNANFGNWYPASLSGRKFNDLDADGVKDAGEANAGLSGWRIYVDYDNDGSWDNPVEPSAVTDANGDYTITDITPGSYFVREVAQGGWTVSYPAAGNYNIAFVSRDTLTGRDFGNWTTASVSGTKFEDKDADGAAQEVGEGGLSGWQIYVDYDNDNSFDVGEPTATTNGTGAYTITGVTPGTYNVREVGQGGWTNSYPAGGNNNVTFESNGTYTGKDFGNWTTASVTGKVFEDLDGDGSNIEVGEPGLATWTVWVDYDDDGIQDGGEPSAISNGSGDYSISGVNPG
ncbi:MAG TPA: SdrD B-like domain-containing protein, partial [Pirellulaceae bacterium]|nr:SdrD B-like domain-containing protein [Pirellulaceae bacterium]